VLVRWCAGALVRWCAGALVRWCDFIFMVFPEKSRVFHKERVFVPGNLAA